MTRQDVIKAALAELDHTYTFAHYSEEQRIAARSVMRGMMMRLGLYDEYLRAQGITPTRDERRNAMP